MFQLLFQVIQQGPAILVSGKGIEKRSPVLFVKPDLLTDSPFIGFDLVWTKTMIFSGLGEGEMLNISGMIPLTDDEVRGIGLSCC